MSISIKVYINDVEYSVTELYRHRHKNYPGHYRSGIKEKINTITGTSATTELTDEDTELVIKIKGKEIK